MPDQYAVIGNPVAHSKSPWIHAAFAEQTGETMVYTALLAEVGEFSQAVDAFRAGGGRGLNVTVPFKEDAFRYADECSDRAALAGAVNTLIFTANGDCEGDNTDGLGLVRDILHNQDGRIAGRQVLLLGAGGAARGVLGPLLGEQPAGLVIGNRTADRAELLAARFADHGPVTGSGLDALAGQQFDLVINATAASLKGALPVLPDGILAAGGWCYDMMYQAEPTPFMTWGLAEGAGRAVDGLGMLVEQAAESFYLWRHVRPDTAPVLQALRRALKTG
jgi:shikimate dehydrogenase